jgi:hypothetical protein
LRIVFLKEKNNFDVEHSQKAHSPTLEFSRARFWRVGCNDWLDRFAICYKSAYAQL